MALFIMIIERLLNFGTWISILHMESSHTHTHTHTHIYSEVKKKNYIYIFTFESLLNSRESELDCKGKCLVSRSGLFTLLYWMIYHVSVSSCYFLDYLIDSFEGVRDLNHPPQWKYVSSCYNIDCD